MTPQPSYADINDLNTAIRCGARVLYPHATGALPVRYVARVRIHTYYVCSLADGRDVDIVHTDPAIWTQMMAQLPRGATP